MDVDVEPDWDEPAASTAASDRGAGPLGFAGTVSRGSTHATGLATLPSDDFDGGPSSPMLPHTWSPEGSPREGKDSR